MKTNAQLDEAGRLTLPEEVRQALGLTNAMSVQIELVNNAAIIIAPVPSEPELVRRGKRWVYAGKLPKDWDSAEAVRQQREDRINR